MYNLNLIFIFNFFTLNYLFLIILDCFNMMMSKIILKNKKYFNIFLNKKTS